MREIVIVISDLYLAPGQTGASTDGGAGAIGTLSGFEHTARFGRRRSIEGEGGWRAWLARWLGREDLTGVAPAVIAAAAVNAVTPAVVPAATPAHDSTVWIATPVHLIAGLTSLHLDRRSLLRLSPTDLEGFASDFNRTFGDTDLRLVPLASGDFLMRGPTTLVAATTEPSRALVADLEASLPKGSDAKAIKRLGAELEMWLHATPLNEARQRRGELPVRALWLWGGGPATTAPAEPAAGSSRSPNTAHTLGVGTKPYAAFGSDPYLAGLCHLLGISTRALPDDQLASLLEGAQAQRAVLVAEVTPLLQSNPRWSLFEALAELDRLFISPAVAALRAGIVESVVVIANNTEVRLNRGDHLRFWRRRQPALMGLEPP